MPYSVKGFFEINEDMVQILLMLEVLFTQNSKVEDLFCGASSGSEPSLFFSNYFFSLGFQPIQDDFQHDFARMTDEADEAFGFTFINFKRIVSSKIYDKNDDFDFDIVNFPFLDGDIPRSTSYGVYISQLFRFARVSSHVTDFSARNKILTAKLLHQGYRYHKPRRFFSKFHRQHYELVSNFKVGLKSFLQQGLSEPDFYGVLVYKLSKIVTRADFSDQFREKFSCVTNVLDINVMR